MAEINTDKILILFSGLPGALKTFISSRLASRLGCLWLPTSAFGRIDREDDSNLDVLRGRRYERCVEMLKVLDLFSARVVLDGGFLSDSIRRDIFSSFLKCPKILVICSAGPNERRSRLRIRANDKLDSERESAESLVAVKEVISGSQPICSDDDLELFGCDAIVQIDTVDFQWQICGSLTDNLRAATTASIERSLSEYCSSYKSFQTDFLGKDFDELAQSNDEHTEWMGDSKLLAQLRVDLPETPSDVLDVGSGTGLAAQWYTEQGHRCVGVDISAQMSVRAARRLLFTTYGSAVDLPFFDNNFDLVLMRQVLHYTEPVLALKEALRVVKPGGWLVISSIIAPSEDTRSVWEEFKNVTQPLRLRVFSQADLLKLISDAGFRITEVRNASLIREENFRKLSERALEPKSGWTTFVGRMEKIFAEMAPQLEFKTTDDRFEYRQYWATFIAQKEAS